jgi:MFS family permease
MVNKRFGLLLVLTALVNTGLGLVVPVMPNLLKTQGFSTQALAIPFFALVGTRVFGKSIYGILSRYMNYRALLLAMFSLYIVSFLLYPFCHALETWTVVRALEGLAEGVASVVLMDLAVAFTKSAKNRGQLMGLVGSAFGLGLALGPVLGSAVMAGFGVFSVFYAGALLGLVGVIGSLLMRIEDSEQPTKAAASGLKALAASAPYLGIYGPQFIRRGLFFTLMIALPLYLHEQLRVASEHVGYYFTLSAIFTTFGLPLTGRLVDKIGARPIAIAATLVLGGSVMSFALARSIPEFLVLYVIEVLAFTFLMPAGMKLFADAVDRSPARSSIVGTLGTLAELLSLALSIGVPALLAYSASAMWAIIGALCLSTTLALVQRPGVAEPAREPKPT